ncbi:MAG TPA: FAD-dependent oxidoreductase [Vicinamibacteria bacterium]|nr:FAD-dependent oxidoreductase [Vicinamibacteria bacterium]
MAEGSAGTESTPLRVAIIGAGPTGFYTAEHLFKQKDLVVEIDLFDRLPTPFGLVRGGVAPDHQKIKSVTKAYDRIAAHPRFRYFGYVEFGTDLTLEDVKKHYHQVVFTVGAQIDRSMGIPGEDLPRSHAATEFVAWYNGHPDYREREFDLSQEAVAVVGVGNVAVDVCRILCRSKEELEKTDVADYALEALAASRVNTVYMLGRRGPAQAAFTNPEIKELGEMEVADIWVPEEDARLDETSKAFLERNPDSSADRKVEILQQYAAEKRSGKAKKLVLRFCVSPTELLAGEDGGVGAVRLVKNELYLDSRGGIRPRATDEVEEIPAGLVFRSVGYYGVALPGVPFREDWGVIPNEKGRVVEQATGEHLAGQYCAGWIKRGPSGVIGTNKPDALETVKCMLEDLDRGVHFDPELPSVDAARRLVEERKPSFFSYDDWKKLDALEIERAAGTERPRLKFTSVEEMQAALSR